MSMPLLTDIHNRSMRLTAERRQHLETAHPEMADHIARVTETLANPDTIVRSRTEAMVELFYKHYPSTPVTDKCLCTVVKALPDDHCIIPAYYTDTVKRGEVLWEKK